MSRTANVTLVIRHDIADNWRIKNPILQAGEFGLEEDTLLCKVGNGLNNWIDLPYINKINSSYLIHQVDGTITFSDAFLNRIQSIVDQLNAPIVITNDPVAATDPANKAYVDAAIAAAGHLKRSVVNNLPSVVEADPNTIYMVVSGDKYDEYILVNNKFDRIGEADFTLAPASSASLGGVLSSTADNYIQVTQEGFMTLNRVSTSLLYVPDGDNLVINGGNA